MGIGHYGYMGGFGMIVFWIVVVALIVWFFRGSTFSSNKESSETSVEILKKRYASGDIAKDEYEQKLSDLTKNN